VAREPRPSYRSPVDPRDVKSGWVVSDRNGYYDSQNIVVVAGTDGPEYSVVLHHSENREGGPGLRLFSTRSVDRGRTWSALAPIDDASRQSHDGYQLLHRLPDGRERIYLFYGWNRGSDYPPGSDPSLTVMKRTDMQLDEGYWLRVSDDGGRSWGARRWLVPIRRTAIDRSNPWGGATMGMFLCDKPSVVDGAVVMAFQKTADGAGETPGSEAFFLRSPDLLDVDDPGDAEWETLPAGDRGLQAPGGELRLGEEPHLLWLGVPVSGRVLALWRTEVGRLAASTSDDGGATWAVPGWLTYDGRPDGVPLRNPRGSVTPHRLREPSEDGRVQFALMFYNNGRTERLGYAGRRTYWMTVGTVTDDGRIEWSQPEIALWWDGTGFEDRPGWNPDWAIVDGPGYPDFAELGDGTLVVVESNKLAVRCHEVDARILAMLRVQRHLVGWPDDDPTVVVDGPGRRRTAVLPDLRSRGGFTLVFRVIGMDAPALGAVLASALSTVTAALGEEPTSATITKGWSFVASTGGELEFTVTDGFGTELRIPTSIVADSGVWDGREHSIAVIVDGGPRVGMVVVDGRLDDGGSLREQGWVAVPAGLGEVGGADLSVPAGIVRSIAIWDRPLLVTEVIAIHRRARPPTRLP
jgi:hypothetical protein